MVYVLSFTFVGICWNHHHHHLLRAARRVTGPVVWASLHLLFWLWLHARIGHLPRLPGYACAKAGRRGRSRRRRYCVRLSANGAACGNAAPAYGHHLACLIVRSCQFAAVVMRGVVVIAVNVPLASRGLLVHSPPCVRELGTIV